MGPLHVDAVLRVLLSFGQKKSFARAKGDLSDMEYLFLTWKTRGTQPGDAWRKAANPLKGITPMLDFFAAHYGKKYAPNTRETVRRFTVHQFLDAGLAIANP